MEPSKSTVAPAVLAIGALVVLTVTPVVFGIFSPWGCEQFTDVYPMGLEMLRACPLAVEALGENPDKAWGLSNYRIGSSGEIGNAHFATKVTGGRQVGEYQVFAGRTFSTWTIQTATLMLPAEQRIINVMTCTEVPRSP